MIVAEELLCLSSKQLNYLMVINKSKIKFNFKFSALIFTTLNTDLSAKSFDLSFYHIQAHAFTFTAFMKLFVQAKNLAAFFFQVDPWPIVGKNQLKAIPFTLTFNFNYTRGIQPAVFNAVRDQV